MKHNCNAIGVIAANDADYDQRVRALVAKGWRGATFSNLVAADDNPSPRRQMAKLKAMIRFFTR